MKVLQGNVKAQSIQMASNLKAITSTDPQLKIKGRSVSEIQSLPLEKKVYKQRKIYLNNSHKTKLKYKKILCK